MTNLRKNLMDRDAAYKRAIDTIALNDNLTDDDSVEDISFYSSVAMVSRIFGVSTTRIAGDVRNVRVLAVWYK